MSLMQVHISSSKSIFALQQQRNRSSLPTPNILTCIFNNMLKLFECCHYVERKVLSSINNLHVVSNLHDFGETQKEEEIFRNSFPFNYSM